MSSDQPRHTDAHAIEREAQREAKVKRDRLVVTLRMAGMPWSKVVAVDGRTERQLSKIVQRHECRVEETGVSDLLQHGPEDLLRLLVGRMEMTHDLALQSYAQARNGSERVGAINSLIRVQRELADVLQQAGRLPADLSALGHLLDLRRIANAMWDAIDSFREQAEGLPDGVREHTDPMAAQLEQAFNDLIGLTDADADAESVAFERRPQLPPAG